MSRKNLAAVPCISMGVREPPQEWKRMEEVMGITAAPAQPPRATAVAQLSCTSGA